MAATAQQITNLIAQANAVQSAAQGMTLDNITPDSLELLYHSARKLASLCNQTARAAKFSICHIPAAKVVG
jgi:TRAP-type mannitol/chloroaromatic compound transport system substrate-binding protein